MRNTSLDHTEFASIVAAITGAFGDPTRREIYLHIRECGEGTNASQIAEEFSLHPNVARHHLDKLLSGGYLEVSLQKSTGSTAGRPSKTYKISNPNQPLNLDVRRDSILISLLARTLSLLPTEEAEKLAEEVGAEVGAGVVTTDAHTPQVSAHAVSCCSGVQYIAFLFVLVASFILWVSQLHV